MTHDSAAAGVRLAEICASALHISLAAGSVFYYPITLPSTPQIISSGKLWLSLLIKWHYCSISITWWYQTRSSCVKGRSCSILFEEKFGTLAIRGTFPPVFRHGFRQVETQMEIQYLISTLRERDLESNYPVVRACRRESGLHYSLIIG